MKRIDKKELMEILEVKERTLNGIITRGTLEQRLNKLDMTLISIEKEGRNKYYNVDTLSVENQFKRIVLKYKLVGREDKLIEYMKEMQKDINTKIPTSVQSKADKIDETRHHAQKYNDLLVEENYMTHNENEYVYLKQDTEFNKTIVNREEWVMYQKQLHLYNKTKDALINSVTTNIYDKSEMIRYSNIEEFKEIGYFVVRLRKFVPSIMYNTLNDEIKKYFTVID